MAGSGQGLSWLHFWAMGGDARWHKYWWVAAKVAEKGLAAGQQGAALFSSLLCVERRDEMREFGDDLNSEFLGAIS